MSLAVGGCARRARLVQPLAEREGPRGGGRNVLKTLNDQDCAFWDSERVAFFIDVRPALACC